MPTLPFGSWLHCGGVIEAPSGVWFVERLAMGTHRSLIDVIRQTETSVMSFGTALLVRNKSICGEK